MRINKKEIPTVVVDSVFCHCVIPKQFISVDKQLCFWSIEKCDIEAIIAAFKNKYSSGHG